MVNQTARLPGAAAPPFGSLPLDAIRSAAEAVLIPVGALLATAVVFGIFVALAGADPFETFELMYRGAFGTWFSWQNTLQRTAPLLLTALCVALPARLGLVIIGGEGALVIGGLCSAAAGMAMVGAPPWLLLGVMALAGMAAGGAWIALAGALRQFRGVNETISSLLLAYIAIALMNHMVEGPLRDPASLNKPSTPPLGDANMIGAIPGLDVHWGLAFGLIACVAAYVLMQRTTFGFGARMVGGNVRAARMAGLSVAKLTLVTCFLAGAAAGLAGMVEVAAVHGSANASLVAGYGYTGILIAFIARQNPLAVIPVALMFGGIAASGGLLQRRLDLPDATILVLQGIAFVMILASDTLYGRFRIFQPRG
ncbi:ABC transporter permease [Skermanella rosea]|uniref:ABC transporter permease n=1 Tax=Skermanella rosea TaxID=1817965 RepID=UPI001932788F|nr:ABC transporter permease [Skermanella rosea]UEM04213.1 ABC transporter permease [Skermanella rosea]